MENVVLTVHLILALLLIGVVLLQRSEGGGLGLGGGGVMTGRQAANALSRATWILAGGFLITSIALTVIAARNAGGASVVDRIAPGSAPATVPGSTLPTLPTYTPPPGAGQPVLPPGASAPVASPAQTSTTTRITPAAPATVPASPAMPAPPATAPASPEAAAPAASAPPAVPLAPKAPADGGRTTTITVPIAPPPVSPSN